MAKAAGRVLAARGRPQLRRPSKRDWTKTKEQRFFAMLAESCNVTLAAKAVPVALSTVYRRREVDAGFRAAWGKALATGYAQLEMMMLERALRGVEKPVVLRNGETSVMREYSDRIGLALLKMHRDSAVAEDIGVEASDHQEACERILARLARLREKHSPAIETKGAGERAALIRWGLRGGARRHAA